MTQGLITLRAVVWETRTIVLPQDNRPQGRM
jgi:hypothetical protein